MENLSNPKNDILPGYDDTTTDLGGVYYTYSGIATMQAYVTKHMGNVLEIEDINVKDAYQRQGYGKSLCLLAIEYAKKHDIPLITMGIINPDALRMVASIVGFDNMHLHTRAHDLASVLPDISLDEACTRIETAQSKFVAYGQENILPPEGFDPGLYATFNVRH